MAREKEAYRPILASILEFMKERGGGHLMGIKDVAEFCGICERTAIRRYSLTKQGITAEALAMKLSAL